jgi:hypothetical protein
MPARPAIRHYRDKPAREQAAAHRARIGPVRCTASIASVAVEVFASIASVFASIASVGVAVFASIAVAAVAVFAPVAFAQSHERDSASNPSVAATDSRVLVRFPEPMRLHTLANMRDHLQTLQEIDVALARGDFDKAAAIAESRLGLSSLEAHGASHLAPYMPKGMQETGSNMHRAASRFAVEAQNASVSNDVKPALAALANVMEQCVACHAGYRLH